MDEQLRKLIERGMVVQDCDQAKLYLQRIGYYRFSGYARPFQLGDGGPDNHKFKEPTPFEQILDRYLFDRKLRLLLLDAIERIEVAVRAGLSNHIAERHGPHWYADGALFVGNFDHQSFLKELRKQISVSNPHNQAIFIKHFYQNYSEPNLPPSWMVFEDVSFGMVSKVIQNISKKECVEICWFFGIPHELMASWLHSISYVRNLCAHHSRVWNRTMTIRPKIGRKYKDVITDNKKIYAGLVVAQILLKKIAPDNHWAECLKQLLDEHPDIPIRSMGMSEDWSDQAVWEFSPSGK